MCVSIYVGPIHGVNISKVNKKALYSFLYVGFRILLHKALKSKDNSKTLNYNKLFFPMNKKKQVNKLL